MIDVFKTQKGSAALNLEGYSYRIDTIQQDKKIWRCAKTGCKGRIWTTPNNENPIHRRGHDHEPSMETASVKKAISEMKDLARGLQHRAIPKIYDDKVTEIAGNETVAAVFPTFRSIDSSLYRSRRKNFPPLPRNLKEVEIPVEFQVTSGNERFLLHISEDKDTIIFATQQNLRVLSNKNQWFMDGTFQSCPLLYHQVFTIHCLYNDKVLPMVYCILTNKLATTYVSIFRKLRDECVILGINLAPRIIIIDFETGLMNALAREFPDALIRGCYFHFCQAIFRKVQTLGLQVTYRENEEIRLQIRSLMAIAFLPENMIQPTFNGMTLDAPPELALLFEYFEAQWLNNVPIGMWNMNSVRRRTNNDVEGWHYRFNKLIEKNHPNIFEFIRCLVKEQAHTEMFILQINAGQNVMHRNKVYFSIDQRLRTLEDRFANGQLQVRDFLRGIAYNLSAPIAF